MAIPRRNVWAAVLVVMATGIALTGCRSEEATGPTQMAVDKENEVQERVIRFSQARHTQVTALRIHLDVPEDNTEEVVIHIGDQEKRLDGFDELEEILIVFREKGLSKSFPVQIEPHLEVRHKWVVKAIDTALVVGFKNLIITVPR